MFFFYVWKCIRGLFCVLFLGDCVEVCLSIVDVCVGDWGWFCILLLEILIIELLILVILNGIVNECEVVISWELKIVDVSVSFLMRWLNLLKWCK